VGTQLGGLANAEGRYLILNVPAGTHTVRMERIGYASAEQRVTVTAGQAARVDFQVATQAVQLQGLVAVGYGTQKKETSTSIGERPREFVGAGEQRGEPDLGQASRAGDHAISSSPAQLLTFSCAVSPRSTAAAIRWCWSTVSRAVWRQSGPRTSSPSAC
jgi:hypothetical protein